MWDRYKNKHRSSHRLSDGWYDKESTAQTICTVTLPTVKLTIRQIYRHQNASEGPRMMIIIWFIVSLEADWISNESKQEKMVNILLFLNLSFSRPDWCHQKVVTQQSEAFETLGDVGRWTFMAVGEVIIRAITKIRACKNHSTKFIRLQAPQLFANWDEQLTDVDSFKIPVAMMVTPKGPPAPSRRKDLLAIQWSSWCALTEWKPETDSTALGAWPSMALTKVSTMTLTWFILVPCLATEWCKGELHFAPVTPFPRTNSSRNMNVESK